MMDLKVRREDGTAILSIAGKIDTLAAAELEKTIEKLLAEYPANLEIDMEQAVYICSAGLRSFLKAQKAVNQMDGCEMSVKHCPKSIEEIFEMTGFSGIINLV